MVGGIGTVNGDLFGPEASRAIAVSYDYTVLAGTQGMQNHRKKDRLFELAERLRLPIVFFTEGGGGRPGDTDGIGASGLETAGVHVLRRAVAGWCRSSASTPATASPATPPSSAAATSSSPPSDSNIGMGGPAMIEGGGLGVFEPTAIGPIEVQRANGVVDIVVADEAEARRRRQAVPVVLPGPGRRAGRAPTRRCCATSIPADRLRSYDVRKVIDLLFDTGSVLELRRDFGLGMVTALARVEGRPVGVIANNPAHLAGAIDSAGRRQGGPVHAAVRRLRHPDRHAVRHARDDGRARRRGDRPRAPLQPAVRHRRQRHGADGDDRAAQGVRPRRPGDDGRHAPRRRWRAWPGRPASSAAWAWRARCGSATRKELAAVEDPAEREALFQQLVGEDVRDRQGAQRGVATSRSTTSSTPPTPAAGSPPSSTPPATRRPGRQEAPQHRHLVTAPRAPTCS